MLTFQSSLVPLNEKKTFPFFCRQGLKIGEYHQGYILGDSLVLAGAYIQSCDVFRPIVRKQKYLMDYKLNYKSNIHETVGKIKEIK